MKLTFKRLLIHTAAALSILVTFTNCENKWPDNGDLDGMWQLMSVEQDAIVTDKKADKVYWSIRSNLVQFNDTKGTRLYSHFTRKEGSLILTDLCTPSAHEKEGDNDEWITYDNRDILVPFGIQADPDPLHPERLTQTFHIDKLTSSTLILSTPTYTLHFRKF